jgi:uncharacterized protein YkwD
LRRFVSTILAIAAIGSGFAIPAGQADAASLDASEAGLVAEVNGFRASRGLPMLAISDTLTYAAKWMSTDMAVNNYFAHQSLDGRDPTSRMADFGYPARATWSGENLAAGYNSAREVVQGWINSPTHYAVLTNPNYRAIGVGRAYGAASSYKWYWTADFGGIVDAGTTASLFDQGFHARWEGQSPNVTLSPGQTATLVLALKNTGYRGWYQGSPGQQAYIGTAAPLDQPRPDLAVNWVNASRPATTTTPYVGPGQTGWFQFAVRAPSAPGIYRLGVRGVIEGTTWLEDSGVYWTITVR